MLLEFSFSLCHLYFQVSTSVVCFINSTHFLGLLRSNTRMDQCQITSCFTVLEPRSPKSAHLHGSALSEPELLPSLVLFCISSHVGLDLVCSCRANSGYRCPKPQCVPVSSSFCLFCLSKLCLCDKVMVILTHPILILFYPDGLHKGF